MGNRKHDAVYNAKADKLKALFLANPNTPYRTLAKECDLTPGQVAGILSRADLLQKFYAPPPPEEPQRREPQQPSPPRRFSFEQLT